MIITLLRDKFYRNVDQYRTALLLELLPSRHCGDKCVPGWPLLPRHEACLNKRVLHPKRNPGDRTYRQFYRRWLSLNFTRKFAAGYSDVATKILFTVQLRCWQANFPSVKASFTSRDNELSSRAAKIFFLRPFPWDPARVSTYSPIFSHPQTQSKLPLGKSHETANQTNKKSVKISRARKWKRERAKSLPPQESVLRVGFIRFVRRINLLERYEQRWLPYLLGFYWKREWLWKSRTMFTCILYEMHSEMDEGKNNKWMTASTWKQPASGWRFGLYSNSL